MDKAQKADLLGPLAILAAANLAVGGLMHWIGLLSSRADNLVMEWWYYAIFLTAGILYPTGAALMLFDKKAGYLIGVAGPVIGGALILLGFLFPATGFLVLIPGTLDHNITIIGFITLITEPVAVFLAAFCLFHLHLKPLQVKK
jgi:hypothetical protein